MIAWDLKERTQKMKGKRHTTEERIRILRKVDGGKSIIDVCREHNISEQTFHRCKREFGMMEFSQAKRLRELEKENTQLKKIVADQVLGMEILQEALEKSCEPGTQAAGSPSDSSRRGDACSVRPADTFACTVQPCDTRPGSRMCG